MKITNKLLTAIAVTPLMASFAFAVDTTTDAAGSNWQTILLLVVFFAIFYFVSNCFVDFFFGPVLPGGAFSLFGHFYAS